MLERNRFFERLNAMLRGERAKDGTLAKYSELISKAIQQTSTSIVPKDALDKEYHIIIYAKKGTKAGYIEEISHAPKHQSNESYLLTKIRFSR